MKLFLALLLVLILLTGCAISDYHEDSASTEQIISTPNILQTAQVEQSIEFSALYSRTDGWDDTIVYPEVIAIRSTKELNDYYQSYNNISNFDNLFDENVSAPFKFADSLSRYDETYFKENSLLLIRLEEPSGSIRHEVTDVKIKADATIIYIDRLLPEVQDCDMAVWHILIEVAKDDIIKNIELKISDININYSINIDNIRQSVH